MLLFKYLFCDATMDTMATITDTTKKDLGSHLEDLVRDGMVSKLADLFENVDSEKDKKQVEDALIRGIRIAMDKGNVLNVVRVLRRKSLPSSVRNIIESSLIKEIDILNKKGAISFIANLLMMDECPDEVMKKGINVLADNGEIDYIANLLTKNNLSSDVNEFIESSLIKSIEVAADNGKVISIANLLTNNNISSNVRKAVEPALLKGIDVAKDKGDTVVLSDLLKKKGLTPGVKEKVENVLNDTKDN